MLRTLDAKPRLLISILVAVLVGITLPNWLHLSVRFIITWNSGVICFLGLAWLMIARATPQKMRRRAKDQDESRLAILIVVVAAACISLFAIVWMLNNKEGLSQAVLALHVALSGLTVVCSWLLTHTMFAFHYAHLYYKDDEGSSESDAQCLDFPQEKQPDYWDFLYFSFVIGMTCQVSDVQIASRSIRRLALGHGVLTFFFNTVILALSINIIAGLL